MNRLSIASRIRQILEENPVNGKPLTPYQLEKLGIIKSSSMSYILNGKVSPNASTLSKFCEYFQVSIEWIMTGEECAVSSSNSTSSSVNSEKFYVDTINRLSRALEKRDQEVDRLLGIIERITSGTPASCSRDEKGNINNNGTDSGQQIPKLSHPDIIN